MNLFDHSAPGQAYAREPYPFLDWLRDTAPYHYQAEREACFVSAYHDVARLLRDDRLAITSASSFADQSFAFRSSIVQRLRGFFAQHPAPFQELVERVVAAQFQRILAGQEADLVAALAQAVSMAVMAELLGIPESDRPTLQQLAASVLQSYDLAWERRPQVFRAAKAFLDAYFRSHLVTARKGSASALVRLLLTEQHEHRLPDESLIDTCTKLLTAGTTTTAGCLANVLERLVRPHHVHGCPTGVVPADLRRVTAALVRLDTPVLAVKRVATENVLLGSTVIKPGQRIYLLVASANRDPTVFASPHTICWTGKVRSHLSFGQGRYHCLGAPLARLEILTVLTHVLPALGRIRTQDPVLWRAGWLMHEPQTIKVAIDGAAHTA
jgi:cytochrome P450